MICIANQLSSFYIMATLKFNELGELIDFYFPWNHQKTIGFVIVSGGTEVH